MTDPLQSTNQTIHKMYVLILNSLKHFKFQNVLLASVLILQTFCFSCPAKQSILIYHNSQKLDFLQG